MATNTTRYNRTYVYVIQESNEEVNMTKKEK